MSFITRSSGVGLEKESDMTDMSFGFIYRCLTCRKRKTRCAGDRPTCSTCKKNGHKCLGYPDVVEKKDSFGSDDYAISTIRDVPGSRALYQEGSADSDVKQEEPDHAEDEAHSSGSMDFGVRCDFVDRDDGEGESNHSRNGPSYGLTESSCPRTGQPLPLWLDSVSTTATTTTGPGTGTSGGDRVLNWHQRPSSRHDERRRRPSCPQSVSFHDDNSDPSRHSPAQVQQCKHRTESHRVPYFRYFGPTAIVPGYKQMVVDVAVRDRRRSRVGSFSTSSPESPFTGGTRHHCHSRSDVTFDSVEELPFYDNDPGPVHPLIMALLKTFFVHLGCNFPFLKESRIMRIVSEKRLQPILVDAMCALAARFSDPALTTAGDDGEVMSCSEYGNVFSQRAKAATADTFPCPTIGAVQAFILMAYEGFGADQDSTLWMYLGIAIRMAVDLGLQKIVGIQHQEGTYSLCKSESGLGHGNGNEEGDGNNDERNDRCPAARGDTSSQEDEPHGLDELGAIEQERMDTFWTVFFVDRVISSGTGRPVTFRDDDFELSLPEPALDPTSNWPAPFPALVQIIHIYGRASDVLNNIRNAEDLTQEKLRKLAQMESDLTQLYHKQDARLHFNAANFQRYVREGQGSNFILVHFWFHALIIILHQPTLLAPFGSFPRDYQLLANSHELSMSSAKTIADILAFAELIDPKSFIGNPFTSQPMYIAACAFLMESAANASMPASRDPISPSADDQPAEEQQGRSRDRVSGDANCTESSKHALLASNTNQNYQRCYKALQQMHIYWGGVRYILTALDQKAKGIWDCETYTPEEYESTKFPPCRDYFRQLATIENPNSPSAPPVAWSLTGTSNSSSPSLTLLFQSHANIAGQQHSPQAQRQHPQQTQSEMKRENLGHVRHPSYNQHSHQQLPQQSPRTMSATASRRNMRYDPIRQSLPEIPAIYTPAYLQATESAVRYSAHPSSHQNRSGVRSSMPCLSGMSSNVQQKYSQGRSGDWTQEQYGHRSDMAIHNNSLGHNQQQHGRQHSHGSLHLRNSYSSMKDREVAQPQLQSYQSYATPPSHTVSPFEPPALCGTSPATSSLADSGQNGSSGPYVSHAADGGALYRPDVISNCLAGSSFPYTAGDPDTNIVTFDSQEIDFGSVGLPEEMTPQWLAYLPGDIATLFDVNVHDLVE